MPKRIEFKSLDQLTYVGDAWGDPADPPILFTHGGGQTRHSWGKSAAQIAGQGWYAISLDLLGHGESDWDPKGDYSAERLAADMRQIGAQLFETHGQRPVAVGASLGGLTFLAAEGFCDQQLFRALILVDIAPRMEQIGVERIFEFMRAKPLGYDSIEAVADAVAAYLPHRRRPKDLGGLKKNLRLNTAGKWVWHWDPKLLDADYGEYQDAVARFYRAAEQLKLPTLIVRGKLSDVLSEDGVREFLRIVPHAKFTDVADAGHMVAGDQNDVFATAIIDFLKSEQTNISSSDG